MTFQSITKDFGCGCILVGVIFFVLSLWYNSFNELGYLRKTAITGWTAMWFYCVGAVLLIIHFTVFIYQYLISRI